jgi:hypothetical protein
MTIDARQLPQMTDEEFEDLTHGRRPAAILAYRVRTGCSAEEADAVADLWYGFAFPSQTTIESTCDGACEPMCAWCNRQADIAASYRE